MVCRIERVVQTATGGVWYRLGCGHDVVALDYDPVRGHKDFEFCPTCWITERHRPAAAIVGLTARDERSGAQ